MCCYIDSMLLDSHLVPETIVKPDSFVGLMALYESNYLRFLRLIPELDRVDGCFRSRVAGDCDLHVEILERCRYTVTLSLTYLFDTDDGLCADPDMAVASIWTASWPRLWRCGETSARRSCATCTRASRGTERRWKRNIVLNKWLDYLADQGHLSSNVKTVDSVSVSRPCVCDITFNNERCIVRAWCEGLCKEVAVAGLTGNLQNSNRKRRRTAKAVDLFRNRAELKKEFAALRNEKFQLQDRIKEHQGATSGCSKNSITLRHCCSTRSGCTTSSSFTSCGAWLRMRGKLARFAEQLKQQREEKRHSKAAGSLEKQRDSEAAESSSKIGEQRMQAQMLEDQLQAERHKLTTMSGFHKMFRGRSQEPHSR